MSKVFNWEEEFQKVNRIETLNLPKYEDVRKRKISEGNNTIRLFDDIWFYI